MKHLDVIPSPDVPAETSLENFRPATGLREACGVAAVSGAKEAANLVFLALYALQHRGQESAGVVSMDSGGRCHVKKAMGLVADAFDPEVLEGLKGRVAVGHTRYSTSGESHQRNAQPLVVDFRGSPLVVAHNGTLTNAATLRRSLARDGSIFQTEVDSETLVHLFARSRHLDEEGRVDDALTQVQGAFALVMAIGDTLYAARDARGFRPLVLGRLGEAAVVVSETCALDMIGAEFVREIEPGEVVRIRDGKVQSLRPLRPAPRSACLFELVYFSRPDSVVWGASVNTARRAFGKQLAKEHPVDADCVVAVPDSANSAALGYSEESGLPFELALIRNHYVGRTFIQPSQADRDFRVRVKYNPVGSLVEGRRLVVVDDSLVRGTTSRGLISLLRIAGAEEVHLRIASPPVKFPCYYGIDMPTREELIGSSRSVEEIADRLGADSLGYLTMEGMQDAVSDHGPFCTACWSGNYPAPLTDMDAEEADAMQLQLDELS